MQAPLDHEILYNALRNIESKSVKEVKSELYRVSLDIFRACKGFTWHILRWDETKLGSEERLHFASCLTFCVQTSLLRVASVPLSKLVSEPPCSDEYILGCCFKLFSPSNHILQLQ